MNLILSLLVGVQMLTALSMIGLILVQHGKGADMGAAFGSGSAGSLFGASGSANFLSRTTAICATVFFAVTVGMSIMSTGRGTVHADVNRLDAATPAPAVASAPANAASTAVLVPASAPSAVQGVPTR